MSATKPTIPQVWPLIHIYYRLPVRCAVLGGCLHITLEDGNITDGDLDFCISFAEEVGDREGAHLAGLVRRMSRSQRRRMYQSHSPYPDYIDATERRPCHRCIERGNVRAWCDLCHGEGKCDYHVSPPTTPDNPHGIVDPKAPEDYWAAVAEAKL